ncbi:DUF1800 domain-containing protein [Chachezhania antarctica]|uniref:DUF1800 domain-containing protein n=1 Tax=Chachezhania antarctica TaxID=2340860 RepID=UPI001F0954DC|nr:DUF1800 domain-containing protein [Chachezhania antarctica]
MLAGLEAPDEMAIRYPVRSFPQFSTDLVTLRDELKTYREALGKDDPGYRKQLRNFRDTTMDDAARDRARIMQRWTQTEHAFRERLVLFWTDHFTAYPKTGLTQYGATGYVEDAIRPHLTGRFEDLLIPAVTHPVMLLFLDQRVSAGPSSRASLRGENKKLGLNENLAREVMELHTLGVDGSYTQGDVRQLAELLTGLSTDRTMSFQFRDGYVEPGAETVLGRSYGGDEPSLDSIHEVLRDLARHPDTARHIARKLATHFVSDTPPANLVAHIEARYRETDGALLPVYAALLEHPAAWDPALRNVKPAADFVASACRALDLHERTFESMSARDMKRKILRPMQKMGQNWQLPPGPDGWPEEDIAWITPQSLASRLDWAMAAPRQLRSDLPDPRLFAQQALGTTLPPSVAFAAKAAEQRYEAIGLVLVSPAFQRR